MPSCRIQSSTSAIQVSSLSERPSDRMVLMPSWLHSFIMSDRSSTRQCAWSAEMTEALPCLPQGWRERCRSLNGKPSLINWLITCSAPALVLSTLDAPAYEMIWNSMRLPAILVNERSFKLLQSIMGLGILIWGHQFGSFEPHIIPIRNYSYV